MSESKYTADLSPAGRSDGDHSSVENESLRSPRAPFVLGPAPTLESTWECRVVLNLMPVVLRHPRALLACLRFVSYQNETATEGETLHLTPFTKADVANMLSHPSIQSPPAEFREEILELINRVQKNIQSSE
jgi:hypothetical protein